MSNNQYEIFPEDVEDIYVDQAPIINHVTSFYTQHGIKCIDSEYTSLILNMGNRIKNVYRINRRQIEFSCVKTRKVDTSYSYHTFYDEIKPGEKFHTDVRIVWEDGHFRDFTYIHPPLIDNTEVDVHGLEKSIRQNPNLHVRIKENLLDNISRRDERERILEQS